MNLSRGFLSRLFRRVFNILPLSKRSKSYIRKLYRSQSGRQISSEYQKKVLEEVERFSEDLEVHNLPEIFHYWSHKYLLPMFNALDIRGVYEFFADTVVLAIEEMDDKDRTCHIVSVGSGNCDIEVEVAKVLRKLGYENYVIECIDIVPDMLERGRALSEKEGFRSNFIFTCADSASWSPDDGSVDVVMAHQSLHHFVDLEILFDKIKNAIGVTGLFVTSDIIGRNGHMRWPEAMRHIDEIWNVMPQRYKFNHLLQRTEQTYENWDCSSVGFEGIRAQDILPLLLDRFSFKLFLGYGNLSDIFIDRAFGHNLKVDNPEDIAFIDKIAVMDQNLIESGDIKPTHIMAIMVNSEVDIDCVYYKNLAPEFCVRDTELNAVPE